MKILVFGSADNLSSKMIDVLEDMLVHQQRLKAYEMLHHGVLPQSAIVHHDLQLEKIAETKSLLHRVVFEKTKLQLKHVKRERLLKSLDLLSSRMQDSQTLRANMASLPLGICTSTFGNRLLSVNPPKEHEVNLKTMFHSCCKLKAEPGVGETITLVTEHLAKKTYFRFIRLDLQMWMVQGIASLNGQHNVILNHSDFIIQSIEIIVGPTSSVRSSFKLNEKNITKNFPNMDACIAFGFVFNAETAHKGIYPSEILPLQLSTPVDSCTSPSSGNILDKIRDAVKDVRTGYMRILRLCRCVSQIVQTLTA